MKIKKSCFSEMVEHCKAKHSHEACGILAGKDNLITKIYKMTNASKAPASGYFIDSQEQLKVFKEMRISGLEMLGIYHSHVASSPHPSPRDVEMAFYSEVSYVIISLTDFHQPEVGSFKIVEGKIKEEKLTLSNGNIETAA